MDITQCSAFYYPVRVYDWDISTASLTARHHQISEHISRLAAEAGRLYRCPVSVSESVMNPTHDPNCYEVICSITVNGPTPQVISTRGHLLRKSISEYRVFVTTSTSLVLTSKGTALRASFSRGLDEIMKEAGVRITCYGHTGDEPPQAARALTGTNVEIIEIVGVLEAVEKARVKTVILLDEAAGLISECMEIDPRLHYIVAGRKREVLERIMRKTLTNIMLPSPISRMPPKAEDRSTPELDFDAGTIWITGTSLGISKAKEALVNEARQKALIVISRTVQCLPRRLDWMLLYRRDSLIKIMYDNGVYLQLPSLGAASNVVVVTGDNRVYVERAIKALMHLATELYIACIQISPLPTTQTNPYPAPSNSTSPTGFKPAVLSAINDKISFASRIARADVVFRRGVMEIYGVEPAVKDSFRILSDYEVIQPLIRDTKFQLELALEHKEFILGKKNGKTNKILKASGVRFNFEEQYNGFNMLVDIYHVSPARALEGLQLLEDELPAEISFHVPEIFHKRIIGVGGKNIQRIMKKYGVYVKFSNADEFLTMGGYFDNEDNVIARTPAKNAMNLGELKASVMELVTLNERVDYTSAIFVPRHFQRMVIGPRGRNLMEIQADTSVDVIIPDRESSSDLWTIIGMEDAVEHAKQRIIAFMPDMYEFTIPASPAARKVLPEPEFGESVIQRLHREHGIELLYHMPRELDEPSDCRIILYHYMVPPEILNAAQRVVPLKHQPAPATRSSSYAKLPTTTSYDSFRHFDSKLLAPVATASTITEQISTSNSINGYNLFARGNANHFDLGISSSSSPKSSAAKGPNGRTLPSVHSLPDLHAFVDAKPFVPSGAGGVVTTAEQHSMRRSHSFQRSDTTPENGGRPRPKTVWDAPDLMKNHSTIAMPIFAHTDGALMAMLPTSANRAQYGSENTAYGGMQFDALDTEVESVAKVPNGEFCGMSLSKSMDAVASAGLLEKISRIRPRSTLRDSFHQAEVSSSDTESEEESEAVMNTEMIDQMFKLDGFSGNSKIKMLLESINCSKYAPVFMSQDIDFKMMLELTESDLKELGVRTFGSRRKILNAIKEVKAKEKESQQEQAPIHIHTESFAASPRLSLEAPSRISSSRSSPDGGFSRLSGQ
ncbi:hypothetical protein SmJEL517_g02809 [Synchytrium microbalum]|uniref:SAM domain-containing protein n=1 Tax=Synchytrium microbalum TaxID=1806994 RepID=A0A507C952_9FUNG|nr:uncharacterized protein SmJEL517_g02809 [Synchytrium microbalum]TPX34494.1 hypothetical protein SmJEL517_g02809 [Synchytrium microbalum]